MVVFGRRTFVLAHVGRYLGVFRRNWWREMILVRGLDWWFGRILKM
jgi:hypothetical protein